MTRAVPLSRGYVAVVDDADYEMVLAAGPWAAMVKPRSVYAQRKMRGPHGRWTTQLLHCLLTGWPETDHVDADGLNNQRSNLRPATRRQNAGNQRKSLGCRSPYKGVNWSGGSRPWRAQIYVGGKSAHLGYFATQEEAARAYDEAAAAAWGEYARPNFPRRGDGHA